MHCDFFTNAQVDATLRYGMPKEIGHTYYVQNGFPPHQEVRNII